eukprot:m.100160 g.100160  ORF g.100160 m.100160 type:complete len:417 (-) comp15379_c0_seq1:562-1812(-)
MALLCELNLACMMKEAELLLVPSLLPPTGVAPELPWQPRDGACALGRRLVCSEGGTTAFSPGLFPRVQAICWNNESLGPDTRLWFNGLLSTSPSLSTSVVAMMDADRRSVDVCAWSIGDDACHALTACRSAVETVLDAITATLPECCNGVSTTTLALSPSQLLAAPLLVTTAGVFGHDLDRVADAAPSTPSDTMPTLTNPDTGINDTVGNLLGLPVLRLLVIRSNSDPIYHGVDSDREERLIHEAIGDQFPTGCAPAVEIATLGHVTAQSLVEKLDSFQPDWIHYIGHGRPGSLQLVDEWGMAVLFSAEELAGMIANRHVRGLVLNCCFSSTLVAALKLHVGAVIAGSPDVRDTAGVTFAHVFWAGVFRGDNLQPVFDDAKAAAEAQDDRIGNAKYRYELHCDEGCSLRQGALCSP